MLLEIIFVLLVVFPLVSYFGDLADKFTTAIIDKKERPMLHGILSFVVTMIFFGLYWFVISWFGITIGVLTI